MLRGLALAYFLILTAHCFAQNQSLSIKGKIVSDGASIDNVTLLLVSQESNFSRTVFSLKDGTFNFNVPKNLTYQLSASKIGFHKEFIGPIESNNKSEIMLPVINLKVDNKLLSEVIVKGQKPMIDRRNGKTILNISQTEFASGVSILEIMQMAPGITIDPNDRVSIKGRAGVSVYIDGKLLTLNGEDLGEYLKSIPSNNIESIEIDFSPSAKYDAAGNGGIINIKFKKGVGLGTNGSYAFGGGIGKNFRYNSSLSLNHRSKKLTTYGNFDYSRVKAYQLNILQRNVIPKNTFFDIQNNDVKDRNNFSLNWGLDYSIGKSQKLGILVNAFKNTFTSDEDNLSKIFTSSRIDSSVLSESVEDRRLYNGLLNLNYVIDLKKKGAKLSFDADALKYRRNSEENFKSEYYYSDPNKQKTDLRLQNLTPADIALYSFKFDFINPLPKEWKIETGAKLSLAKTESTRTFNLLGGTNPFSNSTNGFNYQEQISAAYGVLRKQFKTSNLTLQLRTEFTHLNGKNKLAEVLIDSNYLSFFPGINYQMKVGKKDDLTFSFNRRINRPEYQDLNPFIYFLDQYTYNMGNTRLRPSYVNAFEMVYTFNSSIKVGLQYNHVKDFTYTIYSQNDINQIATTQKQNFAFRKTVGIDVNAPIKLSPWLNSELWVQGFHEFFKFNDAQRGQVLNNSFSLISNLNNSFKISKGFSALLNFHYESPTAYGIYRFESLYYSNLSISKSVIKNLGNIRLTATDIFNTNSNRYRTDVYNLNLYAKDKNETQTIRLSFSYRFGNSSVKSVKSRSVGVSEEKDRIKD